MNPTILIIIAVVAVGAIIALLIKQHGGSIKTALAAGVADLKSHVTKTAATQGDAIVAKVAAPKPAGAAVTLPPPAAPATPSAADAPPPASVALAAAGGGGTELSNGGKANPPQPTRSPAGYPLWYALGAGNEPVGAPRVMYDGETFADDAEVASFITAKAANMTPRPVIDQVCTGPVPVTSLTTDDIKFLIWAMHTPGFLNWQYEVLRGTGTETRIALAPLMNNIAWLRNYDHTKYTGPLLAPFEAATKKA